MARSELLAIAILAATIALTTCQDDQSMWKWNFFNFLCVYKICVVSFLLVFIL